MKPKNPTLWRGRPCAALTALTAILCTTSITPAYAGKPGGGGAQVDTGTIYYQHRTPDQATQLWRMNPDTSGKQLLLNLDPAVARAPYEPSRTTHAGARWFLTLRPVDGSYPSGEPRFELFALRQDGLLVQLTDNPAVQPSVSGESGDLYTARTAWPRWLTVNGDKDAQISYVGRQWNDDGTTQHGVFACPVDWAAVTLAAQNPPAVSAVQPTAMALPLPNEYHLLMAGFDWSPNLRSVVFCASQTLWIIRDIDLDVTPKPLVTGIYGYPRWSPVQPTGSTQIAFLVGSWRDCTIQIINPDGTGQRSIVAGNHGKNPNSQVLWSPHGTHLIYEMDVDGIGGIYCFVYRVSVDASGNNALTSKTESPAWPAGWGE